MGSRKHFFLYPFSILYRLITDIRNYLFDTGILPSKKFDIPIICVGNITVGGTGKTPHAEYLACLLKKEFRVAVLSRGYKRKSRGFKVATEASTVEDIGDEPLQISRKFHDIIVAVDRDRVHGVHIILKEFPETDVIILDDGLQHRSIKPGLSILLSEYNRLITRDYLMPYGRLRESRSNRKRADLILISKTPEDIPETTFESIKEEIKPASRQKLFFTSINYSEPVPLFENFIPERFSLSGKSFKEHGIVLVTGIADPGLLREFLGKYFKEIIHLKFPDHHCFGENDIKKITAAWNDIKSPSKSIITTEKDTVRLKDFISVPDPLKKAFFYVPVTVYFLKNGKQEFDNMILEYVRKNKRDS
jgi:tetraacyldisaccharide 4'-kinase